jgi:hypothetical protein
MKGKAMMKRPAVLLLYLGIGIIERRRNRVAVKIDTEARL